MAIRAWMRKLVPSGPTLGLLFVIGVFVVLLAWRGKLLNFIQRDNFLLVLDQAAIPASVALGMLFIVVSGGIDLSVGSTIALSTISAMQLYEYLLPRTGSTLLASMATVTGAVATGGVCGLANGLLITRLRVTPFVATLGMMSLIRGVAHARLPKEPRITFTGATPDWVRKLQQQDGGAFFLGPAVWSVVILAVLVALVLRFTVLGRHCYAIGSNEATARLCGVPVERRKLLIYFLAGLLTGWAGVLMFARTESGDTTCGTGLELEVIAAVVIGGASLSGGRGTVAGTLVGVFLLTALGNLLGLTGMPLDYKYILLGAVVILNTALSRWQRR